MNNTMNPRGQNSMDLPSSVGVSQLHRESMIYLALGTNLGDKMKNLRSAIKYLERYLININFSIIIDNQAILPPEADPSFDIPYLNIIVSGNLRDPSMSPMAFLGAIKEIEGQMGRKLPSVRNAPRIIDIDILLWGDAAIYEKDLQHEQYSDLIVPHCAMRHQRKYIAHLLSLMNSGINVPNAPVYDGDNRLTKADCCFTNIQEFTPDLNSVNQCFDRSFVLSPQLFGICNLSHDSFSDGYSKNQSSWINDKIKYVKQMIHDGASAIDIGAIATNPYVNELISSEEEQRLLFPFLDALDEALARGWNGDPSENPMKIQISIDTFYENTIEKILANYSIHWINDQGANLREDVLRSIADHDVGLISMHSLGLPANPHITMSIEKDCVDEILQWMIDRGQFLEKCGIAKENIMLDPGIGFGKSIYQDWSIIRNLAKISDIIRGKYGYKIMIGHSRKKFIRAVVSVPPLQSGQCGDRGVIYASCSTNSGVDRSNILASSISERSMHKFDLDTSSISAAIANYVDCLRVHNIEWNMRALVANFLLKLDI